MSIIHINNSLSECIYQIDNYLFCRYCKNLPNLDPWINQNEEHIDTNTITIQFENHLLSIKAEHQKRIRPNLHSTYNERHETIVELIDWT